MADTKHHEIVIDQYVPCKCGAAGHYDTVITCSCGWTHTESHGSGEPSISIGAHRLRTLEEAVGIKLTIGYKA